MKKQRVLFVCTHNSARSQMAEGMLRAWDGNRFEVASAGTEVTPVRPEAIAVLSGMGIDISGHRSKSVTEFLGQPWDWVITVCDQARESCPVFPGADRTAHWGFDDPSAAEGTEEERLAVFGRVAQEIAVRIRQFIAIVDRLDGQARHQATELPTGPT
jgi:arsenate reductase